MRFSRGTLAFLALAWVLVVLYPDPTVLVSSVRNLLAPRVGSAAASALAARLTDDPREIERLVLGEVVPYASDWEAAGVPWSFPTAGEALAAGRGDCESRAVVLASILEAKGIPYTLRLSFDHIWVDYPGKVPTASENDARALTGGDGDGWSWLHWPDDLDLGRELRAQRAIYWDPMPEGRKALLFVGLAWVVSWNALAMGVSHSRRSTRGPRGASTPRGGRAVVYASVWRWTARKMTTGIARNAPSMAMRRTRNAETAVHTAISGRLITGPFRVSQPTTTQGWVDPTIRLRPLRHFRRYPRGTCASKLRRRP